MAATRDRSRPLDVALIVLAFASVLVFTLHVSGTLDATSLRVLVWVDLAIVGAYLLIFLAKGLLDERPARWFLRHAWLAVGLMPLTIPVLLAGPWFLLLQVAIVLLRAAKAIDRALHLHVVSGLSEHYRAKAVEELTQPLLMDLARQIEETLTSRDYAAAMARRLHDRRDLVEAAVRRGLEASPRLSRLASFPPVRRWIDDTTREAVDAAHAALSGPEVNALVREAFHDAFAELRKSLAEPKWPHRGVDLREAAHRLAEEAGKLVHVHPRHDAPAAPLAAAPAPTPP